jgi:hypothetical protein
MRGSREVLPAEAAFAEEAYNCFLVAPPEVIQMASAVGLQVRHSAETIPTPPPTSGLLVCFAHHTPQHLPQADGGALAPVAPGAWVPLPPHRY